MILKHAFLTLALWQRYGELSKQRLDRAILTFFQNFRKSYVGDQAMHSSKVTEVVVTFLLMRISLLLIWDKCGKFYVLLQQLYARLSDLIGLNDHLLLLDFFVRKIATNLKCYTEVTITWIHLLILFLNFFFSASQFFLITEWRSYWPNLGSVFGASIWVCLLAQYFQILISLIFSVSLFSTAIRFFLQLHDWKVTS